MSLRDVIVLTGGPGGGKSTLMSDILSHSDLAGRFVTLPEAAHLSREIGVSPSSKLFQRVMVEVEGALEDGLDRALGADDRRVIICQRGTLDPLAFWLDRGWPQDEFFAFTGTTLERHYRRYAGVIHLVTSADGVPAAYTRWPDAHRPEDVDQAIRLDRYLHMAWCKHPCYHRIDNEGRDWCARSQKALAVISQIAGSGRAR